MADLTATATTEEDVLVTLAPKTAKGNPAVLEIPLIVTVLSGGGTFTIVDETHVQLHTTDAVDGTDTVYEIKGDADLGAGTSFIIDTVTLTTTGALAVTNGITLSNVPKGG